MASEEKQDVIATGLAAKALLANEALKVAIVMAQEEVLAKWVIATTVEEREKLHGEYCGIPAVVKQLVTLYDRGEHELAQEK